MHKQTLMYCQARRQAPLRSSFFQIDPREGGASHRAAALLVVSMDLHPLPYLIDVVGVAAGEFIDLAAALCVDHENTPDRHLAVVGHERAGSHHAHLVVLRLVEVNAMRPIELGARIHRVLPIRRVDHEQHLGSSRVDSDAHPSRTAGWVRAGPRNRPCSTRLQTFARAKQCLALPPILHIFSPSTRSWSGSRLRPQRAFRRSSYNFPMNSRRPP